MRRIAEHAGRPLTFSIGTGNTGPYNWPRLLGELGDANAAGITMKAQLMPRAIGMMLGHELTLNPFYNTASYVELAALPLAERLRELRRPEVRARMLAEPVDPDPASALGRMVRDFGNMFLLGDPPDYEQPPGQSIAARAQRLGVSPEALAYDLMLEGENGGNLYLAMANYAEGNLDALGTMLRHPDVLPGLGDGGAHCGTICDGSYSTFTLMHWGRDRAKGRLPLPRTGAWSVPRHGAHDGHCDDRGLLAPGHKADLNVIDFDRLHLHPPRGELRPAGRWRAAWCSAPKATWRPSSTGAPSTATGNPAVSCPGGWFAGFSHTRVSVCRRERQGARQLAPGEVPPAAAMAPRHESGCSAGHASTCPSNSCNRMSEPAATSVQSKASSTLPSSGRRSSYSASSRSSRAEVRERCSARRGCIRAVPHQDHRIAQRIVQPALALHHALQHHRVAAGVQEAPQPALVFTMATRRGGVVELRVGHEAQARHGQPAVLRRGRIPAGNRRCPPRVHAVFPRTRDR